MRRGVPSVKTWGGYRFDALPRSLRGGGGIISTHSPDHYEVGGVSFRRTPPIITRWGGHRFDALPLSSSRGVSLVKRGGIPEQPP